MKILMLGWELPPFNSGGLGVACYHLCQQLTGQGVRIDFVMPYRLPRGHAIDFMALHHAVTAPVTNSLAANPYGAYSANMRRRQQRYLAKVDELAANNSYDAIHAHDWLTLEAGVHAKKRSGKPLIAHVHSTEFDRCGHGNGNPVVHDIEYNCLLLADRIIAVSSATKQLLVDRYELPAGKIEVIHNASVPLDSPLLPQQNAYAYLSALKSHGYKVVVNIGRLTIQKGLYFYLKAAQRALRVSSRLIFVVGGDGEQRDELIMRSAELGISKNVVFTGFVRGKQLRDLYALADMFVMSSVSEPFGLTALEAASIGTPVMVSRQSGVCEVLTNALTFDFWDTARLADCIVNVAKYSALGNTLAQNALLQVRELTWQKPAVLIKNLYAKVAGAPV